MFLSSLLNIIVVVVISLHVCIYRLSLSIIDAGIKGLNSDLAYIDNDKMDTLVSSTESNLSTTRINDIFCRGDGFITEDVSRDLLK